MPDENETPPKKESAIGEFLKSLGFLDAEAEKNTGGVLPPIYKLDLDEDYSEPIRYVDSFGNIQWESPIEYGDADIVL